MIESQKFNFLASSERTLRPMLFDTLSLANTFEVPTPLSSRVFIELKALDDFDSSRLIAAVFILRLLTGRRPYVARFGLFQTFHTRSYDAVVQVTLSGDSLQRLVGTLSYSVLPFIAKVDFSFKTRILREGAVADMVISDLSFLRVVETHSVFFR